MPKGTVKKYDSDIGRHFGKRDLERLGLFVEMGYMNGKGYVSPFTAQKDVRVKGRQLYPGYPKSKCGTQDGYFDDKFSRIFEKEAYTNMFKLQMKAALESAKKNTSKSAFVVPGPSKQHSSPGDYFGTFGGKVEAFSPELKRKPTYVKQAPNIQTNPGKKGDSGYADITLSKYPEHSTDFYDAGRVELLKNYEAYKKAFKSGPFYSGHCSQPYFDRNPYYDESPGPTYVRPKEKKETGKGVHWYPPAPAKSRGGCEAGAFEKWPKHSEDRYLSPAEIMRKKDKKDSTKPSGVFYPPASGRTMQTCSVVNNKLDSTMNSGNWRNFQPITYPNA